LLEGALSELGLAIDELRELASGIHRRSSPSGLVPALATLADRSPCRRGGTTARAPAGAGRTGVYYTVAEALANAAKHARATRVDIVVRAGKEIVAVEVSDDGVGGADRDGSGLRGLRDRVEALGGVFRLESPATGGTRLAAEIPTPR
jgi:signal transduction histidine kinase